MKNISRDYIPKEELIVGRTYKCRARNFNEGTWNGKSFDYIRSKFGCTFKDEEFHYDDGPPYGTVKPLEIVESEA